ncbi:peptidase S9 [Arthrobacter sp. UCD-GKA]|uniref:S9 family peptidase n=1 Tax=Arthrobacter sp. UCD-GKA TaxID=1913576 RepID=UPI0008DD6BB2|nr:S9 family peptidase [Arthrobacter sp. UCD-GKA]OIH84209.1 peptidase S9 [Arthrobacter sp. UCD-GKA]
MKPEQLELLTTVSAPSLSPDAGRAVVSASSPSFASDSYVGQLWLLELDGSAPPRRLTRGESDSGPRHSPDGMWIAFLRADAKGVAQLAVVEAAGGEPRVLTERTLGVGDFAWSPDGGSIAFLSRTPEPGRYGSIDDVGAGAEAPRHITTLNYRGDGVGFTGDKVQELFTLDVPGLEQEPFVRPRGRAAHGLHKVPGGLPEATARALAGQDVADPCYSPDGRWIYFAAALHEGHDTDLRSQLYRVPAVGEAPAAPELVLGAADSPWAYRAPRFSNDGATLFALGQFVGESGTDFLARQVAVCAMDARATGVREAAVLTDTDAVDYTECEQLVPHGQSGVLALARVRGTGELHLVTAGGNSSVLGSGPQVIHGAASNSATIVVSYASPDSPGECAALEGGSLRQLTGFGNALRRQTTLSAPREVSFTAPDGYPVHGWIHLPQGPGPHPVLLNIHGGPFSQYGPAYFDEAQVYAAAGYTVLQCNPRGSSSYGRAHGTAIRHAMGTVDLQDVMAFLDGACASEPDLDEGRVGVLGGSYGGYLTAWTIAHEHRFAAALVERGFLDPLSFVGTSDIGWFFADAYTGSDPERVAAQSPMAKIGQVRTPTLVMHSEGDYRCPVEQAQRYYVGLKQRGVPTEFVLFPGESHGLSRGGSPWHRRQRFEAILRWFNRYLPVDGSSNQTAP